jgi:hypothetical protein
MYIYLDARDIINIKWGLQQLKLGCLKNQKAH